MTSTSPPASLSATRNAAMAAAGIKTVETPADLGSTLAAALK
jgi:hypothetical protein